MRKRLISLLALAVLITITASVAAAAEQRTLSQKLTRLHVIANSDTQADQTLKLAVRDALIAADSFDNTEVLVSTAEQVVRSNGYDYAVTVQTGLEYYPTRTYDSFALPEGEYNSLRVTIGRGEGQNWWCVLFPPLCFSAAEEFEQVALDAGLTDEEIELVSGQDGVSVRFRIVELVQKLIKYLSARTL